MRDVFVVEPFLGQPAVRAFGFKQQDEDRLRRFGVKELDVQRLGGGQDGAVAIPGDLRRRAVACDDEGRCDDGIELLLVEPALPCLEQFCDFSSIEAVRCGAAAG